MHSLWSIKVSHLARHDEHAPHLVLWHSIVNQCEDLHGTRHLDCTCFSVSFGQERHRSKFAVQEAQGHFVAATDGAEGTHNVLDHVIQAWTQASACDHSCCHLQAPQFDMLRSARHARALEQQMKVQSTDCISRHRECPVAIHKESKAMALPCWAYLHSPMLLLCCTWSLRSHRCMKHKQR